MKKKRMIFDIANFSGQPTMMGVPRYVVELLSRFIRRDDLEITAICSLPEEESAFRNFKRFFPFEIAFQSKTTDHFMPPRDDTPFRPSRWKRLEEGLKDRFPESRILKYAIETARAVKWKIFPPAFLAPQERSPLLERLVRESDIYFSPYHPLIPELDANRSISKVLVVHDLIPVLFADLYQGHRFFLKNPWESLTPDVLVIAVSESTKHDLLREYPHIAPEQVEVVPSGVDERFTVKTDHETICRSIERYGVSGGAPYILSVATLDIRKNFDHVMRCFTKLIERYGDDFPNLQLVLTGTRGWRERTFRNAYRSIPGPVGKRIVFTGYVEEEDLPSLYSGASCFCYMSLYEGFGLPILEAMKSGTPVIAADNSALPEVAGNAGILLDAHDEEGLVAAFHRILTDEAFRRELRDKGLKQAERFSWERCAETILEKILNGVRTISRRSGY